MRGAAISPAALCGAQFQGLLEVAADVAHGGDAAGEPSFEFVFEGLRDFVARILDVGVGIDEAGQNVLAFGVDLGIGGQAASAAAQGDRVERDHRRDVVVLDEDVVRAGGGGAVAIDDDGVADGEAGVAMAVHGWGLGEGGAA